MGTGEGEGEGKEERGGEEKRGRGSGKAREGWKDMDDMWVYYQRAHMLDQPEALRYPPHHLSFLPSLPSSLSPLFRNPFSAPCTTC